MLLSVYCQDLARYKLDQIHEDRVIMICLPCLYWNNLSRLNALIEMIA